MKNDETRPQRLWSDAAFFIHHSSFILSVRRGVAGERELRGEELVGRCCCAAGIFGLRSNAALPFLESVSEVSAKLKEPETKERKFEEVVKSAEQAAVLVLVY